MKLWPSARATSGRRRVGGFLAIVLGVAAASFAAVPLPAEAPNPATKAADDAAVSALVTAEETTLVLTRQLNPLARGLLDLRLPGPGTELAGVFAPEVEVMDLVAAPEAAASSTLPQLEPRPWKVADSASTVTAVNLWRPLLERVTYFDQAEFTLVRGDHPRGDRWRFEAEVRFEALARMQSGQWEALTGRLRVGWERAKIGADGAGPWRIAQWRTESLESVAARRRFFAESLESALRSPVEVAALRRSQHYEATVKHYREGMAKPPHPYFAPISVNQKEGLAVADINGDGFDDLYIPVRLGKNQLLINHGDGTFSEEAAKYHLDLPGHTTCALFADFDNDGDLDALLGRSLLKTTYLENRGGVFVQIPIPPFMPMAVISMAAADYNGDGLLDVYLCTYRPAAPAGGGMAGGFAQAAKDGDFDWPDEFFPPEQAREFRRRLAEHKQQHGTSVLDQLGPPNVLLVNRGGGKFEVAPENSVVGLWRNSLQATWCDYNDDGRPDLYIPNDWGMNVLFRNDGPQGFTDVTSEMGLTWFGFSMGASWGDYDNDGRDDLYVSNMYSEAGRRITERLPGLDKWFAESATGNFLYHREADGKFRQVAGLQSPALTVMRAGWSWGGHFADFDNDGFLDLYVLNGYFTAPRELASGVDLESNLWRTMVRADPHLSRASFRFSPEWKRTPAPDRGGPALDARLVGVDRQGDSVRVHSLHGGERNRFFANRGGRAFVDASGLSGLDNPADSRGFVVLDYDRDGWPDVALVNANQPLFNLYHNEMAKAGVRGGVVALRFAGGNRSASATKPYTCRDGFGARVRLELGDQQIVREHRCGEGWSVQNSATMLVGIGAHAAAKAVEVRWPSGAKSSIADVPEGTLLTVYENPADSPTGEAWVRAAYRPAPAATSSTRAKAERPSFAVRAMDGLAKPARLRAYTTFATTQAFWTNELATLRHLRESTSAEGVDLAAVTVDPADDNARLGAYARQWKPSSRLVNLANAQRAEALAAFGRALGESLALPATVITDGEGRVLAAQRGVPTLSELRRWLDTSSGAD